MNNKQHNRYLGISFLVYGGLQAFFALAMCVFFLLMFPPFHGGPGTPGPPPAFFLVFISFMTLLQLIFTAPPVVAGYALLKQKRWARIAGIIGGVTAAMSVPFGTAVCVYAMWFLFGDGGKELYPSDTQKYSGPVQSSLGPAAAPKWYTEAGTREREYVPPAGPPDWR